MEQYQRNMEANILSILRKNKQDNDVVTGHSWLENNVRETLKS